MPGFIFVMVFKVAFEAIRESIAKARKAKPAPLCADCFFAHVQYAGECTTRDLLHFWRRGTSYEAGRAVLH
jgi:hypothetical protein